MTLARTALPGRCAEHLGALSDVEAPLAYVDLDAFELNAGALLAEAGTMPIRVATKSIRCTALIRHAIDLDPRFQGAMAFTVREALNLVKEGIDDVLLGYPSVDRPGFAELAAWLRDHPDQIVRPMVDCDAHLELIGAAATAAGTELAVCVDVDTAWRPLGARGPAIGPKRSPLRTPEQVAELIRFAAGVEGVRVDALMAYDGQIAGVGDDLPDRKLRARAIQFMQRRSLAELKDRVPRVIEAARTAIEAGGGTLELVNVGGTGSLSKVRDLPGATELAAGSGFYAPTLFDTYRHLYLTPAAFFVLPVVRMPSDEVATVLGGGYIASGATGADRSPRPVYPEDLAFDADEGAGEVQTPLVGEGTVVLGVGSRVVFRHAKAGELCERFDRLHILRAEGVVDVVPTYRGEGHTFL